MPRPSTSYKILREIVGDGSKSEEQITKEVSEYNETHSKNNLFFGIGISLRGALLELKQPGILDRDGFVSDETNQMTQLIQSHNRGKEWSE